MRFIAALLLPVLAFVALAAPATLAFDPIGQVCSGAGSKNAICQQKPTEDPVVRIIRVAILIMSILVGIFAVIMIIIGGLTMVTSAGNSEKVSKARARVIYSLVALVIAALAWTIVTFVINRITT